MSIQVNSQNPQDWLNALIGKRVSIQTVNGLTILGTLRAASSSLVVLADDRNVQIVSLYSVVRISVQT